MGSQLRLPDQIRRHEYAHCDGDLRPDHDGRVRRVVLVRQPQRRAVVQGVDGEHEPVPHHAGHNVEPHREGVVALNGGALTQAGGVVDD